MIWLNPARFFTCAHCGSTSDQMDTQLQGTAVTVEGSGPPVVLIHGMGLNRHMWQWILDDLAVHFQVVRYDLSGHGDSGPPPADCTLLDLVAQLDGVLSGLGISNAILAGFSLGGTLAQAYALERPTTVSAIAVLNSTHRRDPAQRAAMRERLEISRRDGPAGTVDAAIERWFTDSFKERNPQVTDQIRQWMLANDPRDYATLYRVLVEGDDAILGDGRALADALVDIACPALILTGAEDANSTPEMARTMAASIPAGRCEIVPELRHMGLAEDPATFNAALIPFFETADAARQNR